MPVLDRTNIKDAEKLFNSFFPDENQKQQVLFFFANAVIYAHELKANNWNINLDPYGQFIRFNVGHEFCIKMRKKYIKILVLRNKLPSELDNIFHKIEFEGWNSKEGVIKSHDLEKIPDILVKVPDSIACNIIKDDWLKILPLLEIPNREFLTYAINNTTQLRSMNRAHSPNVIAYLSDYLGISIENPGYYVSNQFFYTRAKIENKLSVLDEAELLSRISSSTHNQKTKKLEITSTQFNRNPYIVAYTKKMANGICHDCEQPAPFMTKKGEPFLEVHHEKPLAEGGFDTIDNTIALCPNCHRKRHYG